MFYLNDMFYHLTAHNALLLVHGLRGPREPF